MVKNNRRLAYCFVGQLRDFSLCFESLKNVISLLAREYDVDIYMMVDDKCKNNKLYGGHLTDMNEAYNLLRTLNCNVNILEDVMEDVKNVNKYMYERFEKQQGSYHLCMMRMIKVLLCLNNENYNKIVITKPDIIYPDPETTIRTINECDGIGKFKNRYYIFGNKKINVKEEYNKLLNIIPNGYNGKSRKSATYVIVCDEQYINRHESYEYNYYLETCDCKKIFPNVVLSLKK